MQLQCTPALQNTHSFLSRSSLQECFEDNTLLLQTSTTQDSTPPLIQAPFAGRQLIDNNTPVTVLFWEQGLQEDRMPRANATPSLRNRHRERTENVNGFLGSNKTNTQRIKTAAYSTDSMLFHNCTLVLRRPPVERTETHAATTGCFVDSLSEKGESDERVL
ncbi:hypothetical protein ZHAS_00014572 [Anopheles sinensis]|uniref:Uncharacterized protein n=1 Tax=Anopheles sinensis TaxID=74873 RepID=A0A084W8X0_ANOSI|nr:hypothetical protein ZHAS_00014572 [Anopheles sinensis]